MGGKQGKSAAVIVLLGCTLIGIPVISLGASLVDHVQDVYAAHEAGKPEIKAPDEKVKEWPVVGRRVHKVWTAASEDFAQFLVEYKEPLTNFSKGVISAEPWARLLCLSGHW